MTPVWVEIDEVVLTAARDVLGADTTSGTVNQALMAVVELARRREHAERLRTMDGQGLDDDQVTREAWR